MCCCSTNKKTSEPTVQDPICGMSVDPSNAAGKTDYRSRTYLFCSASCKHTFDTDPKCYANNAPVAAACCSTVMAGAR